MPRSSPEPVALAWVPGAGPVDIEPLDLGLLNQSYRVTRAGRAYALRIAPPDSSVLGIDREWECRIAARAAAAGVGPPISRCEPGAGILVTEWVAGRAWSPGEVRHPDGIDAMARLLGRVHGLSDLPRPVRAMRPGDWIARYSEALNRTGRVPRGDTAALRCAADRVLRATAAHPPQAALCHGDLHRLNVSVGIEGLLLFDWEYAHLSDPYWDLAGWVANNDEPEAFGVDLLASYLRRRPDAREAARLRQFAWLYDYVCLLWSELYLGLDRGGADGVAARAAQLALRLRAPPCGPAG